MKTTLTQSQPKPKSVAGSALSQAPDKEKKLVIHRYKSGDQR
ncbi:MAG TPA: hypothetical protein VGR71_04905 [Nitrospira sp.]|nr:hypothetical protein [Nitrospira sp.]